ncbi:hypothetical protein GCM10009584_19850 [Ornithinimicrobium humiphilum]
MTTNPRSLGRWVALGGTGASGWKASTPCQDPPEVPAEGPVEGGWGAPVGG